jgi:putative heme-binding domain-containing protein
MFWSIIENASLKSAFRGSSLPRLVFEVSQPRWPLLAWVRMKQFGCAWPDLRRRATGALLSVTGAVVTGLTASAAELVAVPQLGLSVARGFQVGLFSDAEMAHDIRAITFTPEGELMVSGPGYIRRLHDRNGDGIADASTFFAQTDTGASGLYFNGDALYCVADGFFSRYLDEDGNGMADGPPEHLFSMPSGGFGGHTVRKGPDGSFYLSAGNDCAGLREQFSELRSHGPRLEAGCVLRTSVDGRNPEIIAHGFRNPVGLDFSELGDLFTADSSVDADLALPWHAPSRLCHVAMFGHHGWRLDDRNRGWPRPDYYFDTFASSASLNRAIPTALLCYRHRQFPPYFRGGLFLCDWARGEVLFARLNDDGPSHTAEIEVFLNAIGAAGFTPNGLAVGPDGSLYVATGGNHTRGAVYRVQYVADPALFVAARNWLVTARTELEAVLIAPQPLEAWSRRHWIPVAERLGPDEFARVAADEREAPAFRARCIEILTELFGGLIPPLAVQTAQADPPEVRARTAWSLGRKAPGNAVPLLLGLARDPTPLVRRAAMEALLELGSGLAPAAAQAAIASNLTHPDKRLYLPAAQLASGLPDTAWAALFEQTQNASLAMRLPVILARIWRNPEPGRNEPAVQAALALLPDAGNRDDQLVAVRLIMLALGDWRLDGASAEVFTGFEAVSPIAEIPELNRRIVKAVAPLFPSGNFELDLELARLLAMVEADSTDAQAAMLSRCTARSSPAADFHFLAAMARLKAPGLDKLTSPLAAALLAIDVKNGGFTGDPRYHWSARFAELTARLIERNPALADELARAPEFARPAHLMLTGTLGPSRQRNGARAFLSAARSNRQFAWSDRLIDLLSALPPDETLPLFQQQWSNEGVRDRLLLELAHRPARADYDKFVAGLLSTRAETIRACVTALRQLPPEGNNKALAPVMLLLRRLLSVPAEQTLRQSVLALVNHVGGRQFKITETGADLDTLRANYAPVFGWLSQEHPALIRQLDAEDNENPVQWQLKVQGVEWTRGSAAQGEVLFVNRGCALCHGGADPLGPELGSTIGGTSPADLILSIAFPSRQVAPAWRRTNFRMRDGARFSGLTVHEGNGVVIVQTGATTNIRLAEGAIASRWPGTASPMPSGLIRDLSQPALADLNAFLQVLRLQR